MSPKERAIELYSKFRNENSVMTANIRAKKQALICIDEIRDNLPLITEIQQYWLDVKNEIELL